VGRAATGLVVTSTLPAGVAAGHPATAAAGVEMLEHGGSAADAAVAAALASCVAETVMTGLLGGAHAIYFDAELGTVHNLDCFCTVPGLGAEPRAPELVDLEVPFGAELVHYSVGPASFAVPGLPAGLEALWCEHGKLPWRRLIEPALRLAGAGVEMPPAHAACLAMLAPVLTLDAGARIYAPGGSLLRAGERLDQPGLVTALESLAEEGAQSVYGGTIAEAVLALSSERGGLLTRADLDAYEPRWADPADRRWLGLRCLTRGGLSGVPETLAGFPRLRGLSATERVVVLVEALEGAGESNGHTTNLVTVDPAGSACVLTSSLGLGSGDYVPGLDLHLNSMLGETDLVTGPLAPGERMESMMAPSIFLGNDGPVLAIGAAGGTRLRTALLTVAAGVLDEELDPGTAVERPRLHPTDAAVNAEPGVDEEGLALLEAHGRTVRRWPELHHYFGGASLAARTGLAADPRRSGAVAPLSRAS
jgi:gamma-glutamyltranspeptidase / glutathione hydrolase